MLFTATLRNQISPPAREAAADMVALRSSILGASDALKSFPSLPKSSPVAGGSSPRASKPKSEPVDKASRDQTKELERKAREEEKAREFVYQIKVRQQAKEEREQAKAAKDQERAESQAGKAQAREMTRNAKNQEREAKTASKTQAREIAKAEKDQEKERKGTYLNKADAGFKSQLGAAVSLGAAVALTVAMVRSLVSSAADAGTKFYTLALGPYGAAKMAAYTMVMERNFKMLFRGIDASPWTKAVQSLIPFTTRATVTGRAMGDMFKRVGDDMFAVLGKLVPIGLAFGQGILYGALLAENAILKLRIRFAPLEVALEELLGKEETLNAVFTAGAGAFGFAAAVLGLVVVTVGLAAGAAIGAYKAYMDLADAFWRIVDAATAAERAIASALGAAGPAGGAGGGIMADLGMSTTAAAKPVAVSSGNAFADGLINGMLAKLGVIEAAGAKMADAADKGVKKKAEIKSPAKLFWRSGRYMGAGTAGGIDESADDVQRAAERSLVPTPPTGGRGGGSGRASTGPISLTFVFPNMTSGDPDGIRAILDDWARDTFEGVAQQLGAAVGART